MYDIANGLRYCPGCNRVTAVVLNCATGDNVCTECALVLGERYVDESPEWRAFAADGGASRDHGSDSCRVGAAISQFLAQPQLGTTVANNTSPRKKETNASDAAEGAGLLPRMRGAIKNHFLTQPQLGTTVAKNTVPRKKQTNVSDAAEGAGFVPRMRGAVVRGPDKPLVREFNAIADMADRLGLVATVTERAKEVLKKLEDAKACPKGGRCRNWDALYAACLHVACRAEGTPRTLKELASVTGDSATAGVKDIGRLVNHIKKHLGEELAGKAAVDMRGVVRAGDYLRRFGSMLGMGNQELCAAQEAARRLENGLDVRRNPDSIAAAIIYMAVQRAGANKSLRDVSTATGVGEITIREVYKELCPHAELLFG